MLITPLGIIDVFIDGIKVDYEYNKVPLDRRCRDLDGRYSIEINFVPDGDYHEISCKIRDYTPTKHDCSCSGERLELFYFNSGDTELAIGMEGDTVYDFDGTRESYYDYDTGYLTDGVQYEILSFTKTTKYVFGIAWMDSPDFEDAQTWFGADPTLF